MEVSYYLWAFLPAHAAGDRRALHGQGHSIG
jgi:hypothetical protein